jgi:hypothetical protein
MASKQARMHGRVAGARAHCAIPGCNEPGEFKAPLQAANFDGPGTWRFLCLEHVREHNAKYNFFDGMSPEEIQDAQGPLAGWERPSRKFAANGADPPPAWSDFADPLDASRRGSASPAIASPRASPGASSGLSPCSASARMPTGTPCASVIRPSSGATTPTRLLRKSAAFA